MTTPYAPMNQGGTPPPGGQMPPPSPVYPQYVAGQWWYQPPKNNVRYIRRTWQAPNNWTIPLCHAPLENPGMCLLGTFFPHCCIMMQRKQLLYNDMKNYTCCGGIWGPVWQRRMDPITQGKEDLFLCLEAFMCLSCAVAANRWMVMAHYNLVNDPCDLILFQIVCICEFVGRITGQDVFEHIGEALYYSTIGCMIAQQDWEMKAVGYPVGVNKMV